MRLYAVADIHADIDRIHRICKIIEQEKPDILICAGDIFNYTVSKKAAALFNRIRIPFYGIRGNTDLKRLENKIQQQTPIKLLDENPVPLNGISLIGINGTVVLPFASRISWFESSRIKRIEPLVTPRTILVSHPPPRGFTDRVMNTFSAGSSGLNKLVNKTSPMMVLCGHIHEQSGIDYCRNTPIINCAVNKKHSGAIIDCAKDSIINIKLIPA